MFRLWPVLKCLLLYMNSNVFSLKLLQKCVMFIYFYWRFQKIIWSNSHLKWISLLFVKLLQIIPEYILLSTLTLNQVFTQDLLIYYLVLGRWNTKQGWIFSTDLLQSFWHCSLTSFNKENLIAFLKGWHCMIISAIWWVVHPVNVSVANVSTVLVLSSKNGTSLSW